MCSTVSKIKSNHQIKKKKKSMPVEHPLFCAAVHLQQHFLTILLTFLTNANPDILMVSSPLYTCSVFSTGTVLCQCW